MSEVSKLLSDIEKIDNEILNRSGPLDLPKEVFEHVLDDLDNSSIMKQFYERGDSYNDYKLSPISCLTTKLVIVGTITPENNHGYYYTSDKNDMYQILDNLLNLDDLFIVLLFFIATVIIEGCIYKKVLKYTKYSGMTVSVICNIATVAIIILMFLISGSRYRRLF